MRVNFIFQKNFKFHFLYSTVLTFVTLYLVSTQRDGHIVSTKCDVIEEAISILLNSCDVNKLWKIRGYSIEWRNFWIGVLTLITTQFPKPIPFRLCLGHFSSGSVTSQRHTNTTRTSVRVPETWLQLAGRYSAGHISERGWGDKNVSEELNYIINGPRPAWKSPSSHFFRWEVFFSIFVSRWQEDDRMCCSHAAQCNGSFFFIEWQSDFKRRKMFEYKVDRLVSEWHVANGHWIRSSF